MSANPSAQLLALFSAIPDLEELRRTGRQPIDKGGGFAVEEFNLSVFTAGSPSRPIERTCFGLYYSPRGSAAGGLLQVSVGGTLKTFGPGDRITGWIERFELSRAPGSVTTGTVQLVLLQSPFVNIETYPGATAAAAATDLLGSFPANGSPTFGALQAEDTDPSGLNPAGSFSISGFSKIRVLIDTLSNAANATSFDLVPWFSPNSDANWFEQGTERVSVPDTDTSGGRYRVLVFSVSGRGQMYLAIRNLLAAARTGLSFIVQGIA
jgi:hypothetical protein